MTTDTQAQGAFQALWDALAAIKCGPLSAHMGHVTSEENEDWRALDINCNSGGNKLIGRPLARAIAQSVNAAPALLAEVGRLTAENEALHHNANILQTALTLAQVDADRWQGLYRRAINEANGLTNYTEDRPELRRAEKNLTAIEAEARALMAARSTNV